MAGVDERLLACGAVVDSVVAQCTAMAEALVAELRSRVSSTREVLGEVEATDLVAIMQVVHQLEQLEQSTPDEVTAIEEVVARAETAALAVENRQTLLVEALSRSAMGMMETRRSALEAECRDWMRASERWDTRGRPSHGEKLDEQWSNARAHAEQAIAQLRDMREAMQAVSDGQERSLQVMLERVVAADDLVETVREDRERVEQELMQRVHAHEHEMLQSGRASLEAALGLRSDRRLGERQAAMSEAVAAWRTPTLTEAWTAAQQEASGLEHVYAIGEGLQAWVSGQDNLDGLDGCEAVAAWTHIAATARDRAEQQFDEMDTALQAEKRRCRSVAMSVVAETSAGWQRLSRRLNKLKGQLVRLGDGYADEGQPEDLVRVIGEVDDCVAAVKAARSMPTRLDPSATPDELARVLADAKGELETMASRLVLVEIGVSALQMQAEERHRRRVASRRQAALAALATVQEHLRSATGTQRQVAVRFAALESEDDLSSMTAALETAGQTLDATEAWCQETSVVVAQSGDLTVLDELVGTSTTWHTEVQGVADLLRDTETRIIWLEHVTVVRTALRSIAHVRQRVTTLREHVDDHLVGLPASLASQVVGALDGCWASTDAAWSMPFSEDSCATLEDLEGAAGAVTATLASAGASLVVAECAVTAAEEDLAALRRQEFASLLDEGTSLCAAGPTVLQDIVAGTEAAKVEVADLPGNEDLPAAVSLLDELVGSGQQRLEALRRAEERLGGIAVLEDMRAAVGEIRELMQGLESARDDVAEVLAEVRTAVHGAVQSEFVSLNANITGALEWRAATESDVASRLGELRALAAPYWEDGVSDALSTVLGHSDAIYDLAARARDLQTRMDTTASLVELRSLLTAAGSLQAKAADEVLAFDAAVATVHVRIEEALEARGERALEEAEEVLSAWTELEERVATLVADANEAIEGWTLTAVIEAHEGITFAAHALAPHGTTIRETVTSIREVQDVTQRTQDLASLRVAVDDALLAQSDVETAHRAFREALERHWTEQRTEFVTGIADLVEAQERTWFECQLLLMSGEDAAREQITEPTVQDALNALRASVSEAERVHEQILQARSDLETCEQVLDGVASVEAIQRDTTEAATLLTSVRELDASLRLALDVLQEDAAEAARLAASVPDLRQRAVLAYDEAELTVEAARVDFEVDTTPELAEAWEDVQQKLAAAKADLDALTLRGSTVNAEDGLDAVSHEVQGLEADLETLTALTGEILGRVPGLAARQRASTVNQRAVRAAVGRAKMSLVRADRSSVRGTRVVDELRKRAAAHPETYRALFQEAHVLLRELDRHVASVVSLVSAVELSTEREQAEDLANGAQELAGAADACQRAIRVAVWQHDIGRDAAEAEARTAHQARMSHAMAELKGLLQRTRQMPRDLRAWTRAVSRWEVARLGLEDDATATLEMLRTALEAWTQFRSQIDEGIYSGDVAVAEACVASATSSVEA